MKSKFFILAGVVLVAVFSRFLPHPWNWTAVGAAALLGGARFEKLWQALLVPLAALVISDAFLGYDLTLGFVYGSFLLTAFFAHVFRDQLKGWKVGVGAFISATAFFVITNFGMWMVGGMYAPTFAGLVTCYVAAIPFYVSQFMGDLFWSAVLFGVWDYALNREKLTQTQTQKLF